MVDLESKQNLLRSKTIVLISKYLIVSSSFPSNGLMDSVVQRLFR